MSENLQEQTEAKLLAFIEGELDEAGRAEIERHLEANPKHRKLIADLSAGRRLLRQLPRESAPQELFEGVESQLERHVLLADARPTAQANPETGNLRISHQRRWVRIRAAAAAVIVATGLGIVVYKSLPERGPSNYSVNTPTNSGTTTPAEPRTDSQKNGDQQISKKPDEQETLRPANQGEGLRKSAGRELQRNNDKDADRDSTKHQRFSDDKRKESDELAQRQLRMAEAVDRARKLPAVRELLDRTDRFAGGAAAGGSRPAQEQLAETSGHEPLFLVVSSGDPEQAKREISSILQQQNARFSSIDSIKRDARGMDQAVADQNLAGGAPEPKDQRNRSATRESLAMAKAAAMPGAAAPAPAPAISPAATPPDAPTPVAPAPMAPAPKAPAPTVPPAPIAPAATPPAPPQKPAAADAANGHRNALSDPETPAAPAVADGSPPPLAPAPASPTPGSLASQPIGSIAPKDPQSREKQLEERVLIVRQIPRSQARYLLERMSEGSTGNQMAAMFSRSAVGEGGGGGPAIAANSAANLQAAGPAGQANKGAPHPAPLTRSAEFPRKQADRLEEKAKVEQRQALPMVATKPANPDAPIAKDETLLLVYRNFKGTSRDMKQPVVLKDGAVYVVGPGNVDVAGLTPTQASEKLTKAMQEKDAKSAGAELRRVPTEELANLAQNGAMMRAPAAPQPRGMMRRGATNPAKDEALGMLELAAGEDRGKGTQPVPVAGVDPLVDVVIVVQGASSAEEAAARPPENHFGQPSTLPAGPTTMPATRPSN